MRVEDRYKKKRTRSHRRPPLGGHPGPASAKNNPRVRPPPPLPPSAPGLKRRAYQVDAKRLVWYLSHLRAPALPLPNSRRTTATLPTATSNGDAATVIAPRSGARGDGPGFRRQPIPAPPKTIPLRARTAAAHLRSSTLAPSTAGEALIPNGGLIGPRRVHGPSDPPVPHIITHVILCGYAAPHTTSQPEPSRGSALGDCLSHPCVPASRTARLLHVSKQHRRLYVGSYASQRRGGVF